MSRHVYMGCLTIGIASVGLIALSFMYVMAVIIFTAPRLPPAPPLGMWVGLLGLYVAGFAAVACHILSGDWRKWLT